MIPTQALFGQLLIGLINGAFYAMLSQGLSVIFGLLNIINFTHGAQYMMGAFVAYFLLQWAGLGYWWALLIAPVVVGITGIVLERTTLKRLYQLDHLYGLLLTFGFALIIQGLFRHEYFFFQAEDGIRDTSVTGVQTCALPIWAEPPANRNAPPTRRPAEHQPRRRGSRPRGSPPCRGGPARAGWAARRPVPWSRWSVGDRKRVE